jgi:putative Ca2+/H+ antiporter (TMEM165/GDT1 family)
MESSLLALTLSVGAVTLAEMGDKTQLLAMAFATKYQASKVLIGVFLATVLNHALAVALGTFAASNAAINVWIQMLAAISFIGFGLWTIRGDRLDGEDKKVSKYGPIATVAIAFFFAEMGDKTQLTTIALAAKFPTEPVGVLLGTTTGMLIADSIGIIIGVVLCKNIPARTIKLFSATVFILFGFLGTWQAAQTYLGMSVSSTILLLAALVLVTVGIGYSIIRKEKQNLAREERQLAAFCKIKLPEELPPTV